MSLTGPQAQRIATAALARHGGGTGLRPLRAGDGAAQAHLFAVEAPQGALVLKVWPEAAAERAARQARRQRQVARALRDGPFRVPGVTFFDAEARVLAMPLIAGRDLRALWQEGTAEVPQAAGGWLAALHTLTRRVRPFDPTGQVNWLSRLIVAGAGGARIIPDLPGFTTAAREVQAMAPDVAGRASLRAVTHRDMTLSNLVRGPDGTIWGIDLDNGREDEALRDLFTLALDLLTPQPDPAVLQPLRATYGETGTDPQVRLFLQRCFCLWVWANTPPRPSARQLRRLEVAETLLRGALLL